MTSQQSQETDESSFFENFVYDRVVPPDHFLRQLREPIPWERFSEKLLAYYQGGAREGRPPYDPALLLRVLLWSFPYDLSERQTEQMVHENIPLKFFVGLAVDEKAPDPSALTAFKARLKANGGRRHWSYTRYVEPFCGTAASAEGQRAGEGLGGDAAGNPPIAREKPGATNPQGRGKSALRGGEPP